MREAQQNKGEIETCRKSLETAKFPLAEIRGFA
jgi:hypothetical protein